MTNHFIKNTMGSEAFMIVYFTGTGNSRYVAEAFADKLNDQIICANELIKAGKSGDFSSETPWVFVCPIYVANIAIIFAEFLRKSTFSGNNKAYFISTAAADDGTAVNEASAICNEKGLEFKGTELIQMPQNYLLYFKMTDEEECNRRLNNSLVQVDKIVQIIRDNGTLRTDIKSSASHLVTHLIEKLYFKYFTTTKQFHVTEGCIGCGICEKKCPLNNIVMENGKPKWIGKCVHCVACINSCPKKVIEFGKLTSDKSRYVCKKYQKS